MMDAFKNLMPLGRLSACALCRCVSSEGGGQVTHACKKVLFCLCGLRGCVGRGVCGASAKRAMMTSLRLFGLTALAALADACTTLVAARGATADGSVMAAHSNDGDGITIGNVAMVPAANFHLPANRTVSGGAIPQVGHTLAYYTKVGGYASSNEYQVGLAESTCVAVFAGQRSKGAMLNIIDLSELGLERGKSARAAVMEMGRLAEEFGYYDNGESLLVIDPREAYIFHVLPDHTGRSAVWVAQRVPDGHVGVVANSFTVRVVDLNATDGSFLYSSNMLNVALDTKRWAKGVEFDFTRIFAGAEPGHKYASGRRMWSAFRRLAPVAAASLSPEYEEYVSSRPYPATLPALNVTFSMLRSTMRDYFQATPYDMSAGMQSGPFGSPTRWSAKSAAGIVGNFERPIAISRTILSYVLVCRSWLPDEVGGVIWIAMHSAHTSLYVPFWLGTLRTSVKLPPGFTENNASVSRGVGAWQASRFVFNAAQLNWNKSIAVVSERQTLWEGKGQGVVDRSAKDFVAGRITIEEATARAHDHAAAAVSAWWQLSDDLMLATVPNYNPYPTWWLLDPSVNFTGGPPRSPDVPAPPTEPA